MSTGYHAHFINKEMLMTKRKKAKKTRTIKMATVATSGLVVVVVNRMFCYFF